MLSKSNKQFTSIKIIINFKFWFAFLTLPLKIFNLKTNDKAKVVIVKQVYLTNILLNIRQKVL